MADGKAPVRWPGLSPLGAARALRKDVLDVSLRAAALGEVVDLRLPLSRVLMVSSPRVVEQVLVAQPKVFSRTTRIYKQLRRLLGNGLLTSDGAHWLRQRRLMQPAYHKERLQLLCGVMARAASEMISGWQPRIARGEPLDIENEFQAVTMRIVAETLLSVDVNRDEAFSSAFQQGFEATRHGLTSRFALPRWVPTRANRATTQSRARLNQVLFDLIARRRENDTANDLLSMFMNTADADTGERMNDAQLFDEVMTVFIAGHETTTALLTWAVLVVEAPRGCARCARRTDHGARGASADDG